MSEIDRTPCKRRKIEDYLTAVVPSYLSDDFATHYRLRRGTVEVLLKEIGSDLRKQTVIGRPRAECINTVLLSVWTLANHESFRGICERFNVGKGHGYRLFMLFCEAMVNKSTRFITWPEGDGMTRNRAQFENLRIIPFPGVVGCVDGTYIPIKGKASEKLCYTTRKGFAAVILQAICNANCKFIDIFVGWPGSSHDARVWRNSPVCEHLRSESTILMPEECHLLGDGAYPLEIFLMVPYKDNGFLTQKQKYYNKKLSSYRAKIEQAFGILKCRFRRLKYLDMTCMDRITSVIVTACILHNICIEQCDFYDIDINNSNMSLNDSPMQFNNYYTDVGQRKRDEIADHIFQLYTSR